LVAPIEFGEAGDLALWYAPPGGFTMSQTGLTAEQRRLIAEAGDRPVRLEDPELHEAYVLIHADVYERVRDVLEPRSILDLPLPEGVRRSQEAFFRDLPRLLQDRKLRGRFVAYHGDERVKIARSEPEVIRECLRRGYRPDQYDIFVIRPQSPESEEVDYPSAWSDA
jgi:hypothetical protein